MIVGLSTGLGSNEEAKKLTIDFSFNNFYFLVFSLLQSLFLSQSGTVSLRIQNISPTELRTIKSAN